MDGDKDGRDTVIEDQAPPRSIEDLEQLEELLSRPTPELIAMMRRLEGDLVILGVGGKTGPSLAHMARRASDAAGVPRRILGVSRFTRPELPRQLNAWGIETISCDLLDRAELNKLPDAPNVLFLAAMKFGSTGQEAATWAMNVYLPGMVAEKYRGSRLVTYSSGNVYRMMPIRGGGSVESDPPSPIGDYAMSVLGRERVFTHFSQTFGTPTALLRLNYAHEMRYGVLVDLAQQVMSGKPIDLTMGYFNAIWQGDSNAMTLRALEQAAAPPLVVNIAGPETLSSRQVAEEFGRRMGKPVTFAGSESPDAFLSNSQLGYRLLGRPRVTAERMIGWIADWQLRGGPTLGKPTHFQTRDGRF
jgi:nucleoside-diphosphate-sugar epimerase